jgi:hypothetical protein
MILSNELRKKAKVSGCGQFQDGVTFFRRDCENSESRP